MRSVNVFLPGRRSMALIICVCFPFGFQIVSRFAVINVVLLGNLVQSVDAGISSFQTFGQMCTGPPVLISRPMKFHACFGKPFLNIKSPSFLTSFSFDSFSSGRWLGFSLSCSHVFLITIVVIQLAPQLFAFGPIFPIW